MDFFSNFFCSIQRMCYLIDIILYIFRCITFFTRAEAIGNLRSICLRVNILSLSPHAASYPTLKISKE